MRGTIRWFNTLLGILLVAGTVTSAAAAASGKSSKSKKPKQVKTIRIYVEARRDLPERSMIATIGRSNPIQFSIEKLPILNEEHVEQASLLDEAGVFKLELKFNTLGSRVLESYTAAAVGRHLAVLTDIDEQARWIAGPLIRQRLGAGVFSFAPDTTREEAERIANGLTEVIEKRRKQWKY